MSSVEMPDTWSWDVEGTFAALSAARNRVRAVMLQQHAASATIESALVLVSEILTNAVVHASSPIVLSIQRRPPVWRFSVRDGSAEPPIVRPVQPGVEGGRGMILVARLANGWGVDQRPGDGKEVWFELGETPTRGSPAPY